MPVVADSRQQTRHSTHQDKSSGFCWLPATRVAHQQQIYGGDVFPGNLESISQEYSATRLRRHSFYVLHLIDYSLRIYSASISVTEEANISNDLGKTCNNVLAPKFQILSRNLSGVTEESTKSLIRQSRLIGRDTNRRFPISLQKGPVSSA
jgi:hypothetical protein